MKYLILTAFLLFAGAGWCQDAPKPADPCQKLDTNMIKKLLIGIWVDTKDPSHTMVITNDSVEETIVIKMGNDSHSDLSYWNYKVTDNIFSTDDVTCYTLSQFKAGYDHHVDNAINSINTHYMLLGASGNVVFKRTQ
jgi:hypothetical protein